jgi:hypothetical protein
LQAKLSVTNLELCFWHLLGKPTRIVGIPKEAQYKSIALVLRLPVSKVCGIMMLT